MLMSIVILSYGRPEFSGEFLSLVDTKYNVGIEIKVLLDEHSF